MIPGLSQIGEWLREQRERLGLSQREAAHRLEKDAQQISKWERGAIREMSAVTFLALVTEYRAWDELAMWLKLQQPARVEHALRVAERPPDDVEYVPLPAESMRPVATARPPKKGRRAKGEG